MEVKPEDTDKNDTEDEINEINFVILGNCLYEQVSTNEMITFVEYNISTGKVKAMTHIIQD